jgi:hypothetical protein
MKNTIKLIMGAVISFVAFMPLDSIAKPNHQLGFIFMNNSIPVYVGENNCGYRIAGTKSDAKIVFLDASHGKVALININGREILLNLVDVQYENIKGRKHPKTVKYKSGSYRAILTNFKYFPVSKKINTLLKITKTLEISNVDGWKKRLRVECIADTQPIEGL